MTRSPLRRADDPFHDWSPKHCLPTTQKCTTCAAYNFYNYLNFRCVLNLKINISLQNYRTSFWTQINIFFIYNRRIIIIGILFIFFLLSIFDFIFFRYSWIIIFDKSYFRKVPKDRFGIEKLRMVDAYYLCEVMDGAESDEDAFVLPRVGHEEGPVVPHDTEVVPETTRCCNVIVGRGYWHLHHFSDL